MKKISLYLFLLVLFAFGVNALSDVKLNNTISNINSATQLVNISFINNESQTIWCQLQVTSPSTANITGYNIFNLSNATNNTGYSNYVNTTINFDGFEDSNDYTLTPYCQNSTSRVTGTTTTSVTIDFGTPDTPTPLTPTSASNTSIVFSATVNGSETTGCTLYFTKLNPGAPSYSMTHSGDSCDSSAITTSEQTYDFYIQATDNTNTTNSATAVLTVDVKKGKIPVEDVTPIGDGKYVYNENGDILCGGYAHLTCPSGYQCALYNPSIADSGGECVPQQASPKSNGATFLSKVISGATETKVGGMTLIVWFIVFAAITIGVVWIAKKRYNK